MSFLEMAAPSVSESKNELLEVLGLRPTEAVFSSSSRVFLDSKPPPRFLQLCLLGLKPPTESLRLSKNEPPDDDDDDDEGNDDDCDNGNLLDEEPDESLFEEDPRDEGLPNEELVLDGYLLLPLLKLDPLFNVDA